MTITEEDKAADISEKGEGTTAAEENGTTSASEENKSTNASEESEAAEENGTARIADGTAGAAEESGTANIVDEGETTSVADEEESKTTNASKENETVNVVDESETMSVADKEENKTTNAAEENGTVNVSDESGTTSVFKESGTVNISEKSATVNVVAKSKTTSEKSKTRVRRTVSVALSFLLTLVVIGILSLLLIQFTLLRPAFLLEQYDASGYFPHEKASLEEAFSSYGVSSGFEEDFFEGMVDTTSLRTDIFLEAERLYGSGTDGADIESFRSGLNEELAAYVESKDVEVTAEIEEALGYLADICTQAYQNAVTPPLFGIVSGILVRLKSVVSMGIIGAVVFFIIILIFLHKIQRRKYSTLRYVSHVFGTAGLFFCVIALYLRFSGYIERIGIFGASGTLRDLATTYVNAILVPMQWFASCGIAFACACALFYFFGKRQSKELYRQA
jgi:hypothetical protein